MSEVVAYPLDAKPTIVYVDIMRSDTAQIQRVILTLARAPTQTLI